MAIIYNCTACFALDSPVNFENIELYSTPSKSLTRPSKRKSTRRLITKQFMSRIIKITDPKVTAMVYQSGKIVLVGSKSQEEADIAAQTVATMLGKSIISPVVISNFAAKIDLSGTKMDLPNLVRFIWSYHGVDGTLDGSTAYYNPESFPGLIYTPPRNEESTARRKYLIFESGKVQTVGCTSVEDVEDAEISLLAMFVTRSICE